MVLYLCPKTSQWSYKPCDCPDRDSDSDSSSHFANEIPDPEASMARLLNLIGTTHDRLTDDVGVVADSVMEDLADVYLDITGYLI